MVFFFWFFFKLRSVKILAHIKVMMKPDCATSSEQKRDIVLGKQRSKYLFFISIGTFKKIYDESCKLPITAMISHKIYNDVVKKAILCPYSAEFFHRDGTKMTNIIFDDSGCYSHFHIVQL